MPKFNHHDLALLNPTFDSPLVDVLTELEYLRRLRLGGTTPPEVFFQLKAIFHMLESFLNCTHRDARRGNIMKIRNGKYILNTDTAIEFDSGSTGRLGHYTTQGDRTGYVCRHRDGAISVAEVGSGYYPSKTGSGYDWSNSGYSITTYNIPGHFGFDMIPNSALEALSDAGLIETIE